MPERGYVGKLTPRVQEMLKDSMQKQERKISAHQGSDEGSEEEEESDGDQRMYCSCRQKSFGLMVACDNSECPFEWFHYDCVKLTQPPKGKWYCPTCSEAMKVDGLASANEV
uniref:PHD-type domain-containing protein n=1 Tax=Syphacia muris TaxID=451379 RepID=A0A0N5AKH5_9BILA